MVTLLKPVQLLKAPVPIDVTLSWMVKEVRQDAPWKVSSPMTVTLLGITNWLNNEPFTYNL